MADIYRQQKEYAQAEKNMREFETFSGLFDENGNIVRGKEMYYSFKGMLCLDTSDKANAEYYFRNLHRVADNYDKKIAAFDGLQRFYTKYFNKDSLVKYVTLSDSICRIAHKDIEIQKTIQAQAMYDYTHSEQIAHQKEQEADRYKIFSALSAILILLFVIAYIHNRDQKHRLEDRIKLLRGYAVNKNLYDSPIAQRFRQLLKANPYQNPSLNDWKELSAHIENEIPNFREKLQTGSHQLSDTEYDICLLVKIQIPSSDIARLKQIVPSYVTQIRKNIYQKIFAKKGRASELDEYIMSLS